MFRVKLVLEGREHTIYNVVCIESCVNEDGNQIILLYENGTGERFTADVGEEFEVFFYEG